MPKQTTLASYPKRRKASPSQHVDLKSRIDLFNGASIVHGRQVEVDRPTSREDAKELQNEVSANHRSDPDHVIVEVHRSDCGDGNLTDADDDPEDNNILSLKVDHIAKTDPDIESEPQCQLEVTQLLVLGRQPGQQASQYRKYKKEEPVDSS